MKLIVLPEVLEQPLLTKLERSTPVEAVNVSEPEEPNVIWSIADNRVETSFTQAACGTLFNVIWMPVPPAVVDAVASVTAPPHGSTSDVLVPLPDTILDGTTPAFTRSAGVLSNEPPFDPA